MTTDPDAPENGTVGALAARLAADPAAPLPEVFRRVCEAAADAVRVERVGVWLFVNGDRALRCVSLFEWSKRKHSKGVCVPLAFPSEYVRAVAMTPLLAAPEARTDPRTAELGAAYFAPNGITSVLDAPLMRDDRLVGVLCCEHVGPPRSWTDPDRRAARAAADLVVSRMSAAETALRSPNRVDVPPVRTERNTGHEFRNVMNELVAHAELLKRMPGLPAAALARVDQLLAAAQRGSGLLRTLLPEPEPAAVAAPAAPVPSDETGEHEPLVEAE